MNKKEISKEECIKKIKMHITGIMNDLNDFCPDSKHFTLSITPCGIWAFNDMHDTDKHINIDEV